MRKSLTDQADERAFEKQYIVGHRERCYIMTPVRDEFSLSFLFQGEKVYLPLK